MAKVTPRRGPLTALVALALSASIVCALVLESRRHAADVLAGGDQATQGGSPPASGVPVPPFPPSSSIPPAPPFSTPPPPPPRPAPVAAVGAPCVSTAAACVKLSTNQAWLIEGGKAVYGPVKITHGRKGWLTPAGSFKVYYKNRLHRSRLFDDAPMPNSVFFNGGIAFHRGSLAVPSHGCIHLSPAASEKFFSTLAVGDPVQVVR